MNISIISCTWICIEVALFFSFFSFSSSKPGSHISVFLLQFCPKIVIQFIQRVIRRPLTTSNLSDISSIVCSEILILRPSKVIYLLIWNFHSSVFIYLFILFSTMVPLNDRNFLVETDKAINPQMIHMDMLKVIKGNLTYHTIISISFLISLTINSKQRWAQPEDFFPVFFVFFFCVFLSFLVVVVCGDVLIVAVLVFWSCYIPRNGLKKSNIFQFCPSCLWLCKIH